MLQFQIKKLDFSVFLLHLQGSFITPRYTKNLVTFAQVKPQTKNIVVFFYIPVQTGTREGCCTMAAILNPQYFNIEERLHFLSRLTPLGKKKKLDPTQGFNIKTNFPKMENKNKHRQSTKKNRSHI